MGQAVPTSTYNFCFEQKYKEYQRIFYLKIFIFFLEVKFSIYLNRRVFVNHFLRDHGCNKNKCRKKINKILIYISKLTFPFYLCRDSNKKSIIVTKRYHLILEV